MGKTIIAEGKTSTEAIEKGLKELNVSKNMVDIKIIEEEKRSFYSILSPRIVKVELTLKDEIVQEEKKEKIISKNKNMEQIKGACENIEKTLKEISMQKNFEYTVEIKDFDIYVNINGENINWLIGYRGENINALQMILSAIANKKCSSKIKVYLDVAGYKIKREKTLQDLADKIARTVIRTKREITLEPMTPYERRIIHVRLQNNDKVKTFSKGEEPYRKVIVSLK